MRTLLFLSISTFLLSGDGFSGGVHKKGQCVIEEKKGSFDSETGVLTVTLKNDDLQASCRIYSETYGESYALYASPTIKNLSDKRLDVQYYASFYDIDGNLIACVTESPFPTHLDVGEISPGYSCKTELPKDIIQKIRSYQVSLYTSKPKRERQQDGRPKVTPGRSPGEIE